MGSVAWCDKEQWKTEAYGKYQGKERQHQEDGKGEGTKIGNRTQKAEATN